MSAFTEKQLKELQSGYVVETNMDPPSEEDWFLQRWLRHQIVMNNSGYKMLVSTVELHPKLQRGNLKYETLVFPTEEVGCEIKSNHYETIEEAREGHRQLVKWAREMEGNPKMINDFYDEEYFDSKEEKLIVEANAALKTFAPYLNVDINAD